MSGKEQVRAMVADGEYAVGVIIDRLVKGARTRAQLADLFRELAPAGVHLEMTEMRREAERNRFRVNHGASDRKSDRRDVPVDFERKPGQTREVEIPWYRKGRSERVFALLAAPVGTGGGMKPWAELTVSDLEWRRQDAEHKRSAAELSQQQCEKLRAAIEEHDVAKVGELPSSVLVEVFNLEDNESADVEEAQQPA